MSDDLIAIIACCILGMIAHGARRQPWLEWVLRVTYCLFLLGEYINLSADPLAYSESPWHFGVLAGVTATSVILMFKPGRQLFSLLFTLVNQIVAGRFLLAACGKLHVSAPPAKFNARAGSFSKVESPLPQTPESRPQEKAIISDSPESGAGKSEEASKQEAPDSGAGESEEASKREASDSGAGESEEASMQEASDSGAGASEEASKQEASDSGAGASEEASKQEASDSGAGESEEASMQEASDSGASASEEASKQEASDSGAEAEREASVPHASGPVKVGFFGSFFAERIFVADSIPHMNALWIYVTCLAFLLTHLEIAGFQMPSIMVPIPVTMDQLFSYNFLGLVMLSVCGTGIFITRKPMEILRRLGLVKPSFAHILIGVIGIFITFTYDWLWSFYTHGQEGLGYADKLSHYNEGTFAAGANPGPAFFVASATGLCAGLGEETLIRGALQPVFGIVPAAFMHGVLHGQFSHAPLLILQVFGWSMIMGIIRRYTNTTTTIITHVGFNFLSTFLIAFNP